jgi:hypothetical protein
MAARKRSAVARRPSLVDEADVLRAAVVDAVATFERSGGTRRDGVAICLLVLAEVGAQGVAIHAVQGGARKVAAALAEAFASGRRSR